MRRLWALAFAAAVAGCASPGQVPAGRLRIAAGDAAREAWTVAAAWTEDPLLRYVEGEGVTAEGYVAPDRGAWRFVYEAAGRADQLVVTVTPRTLEQVTRPPQSPPGLVLGEASLEPGWIDSPEALAAVRAAGGDAALAGGDVARSMLLVPLRPPQWIVRAVAAGAVREWRVNAETGEVLPS